MPQKIDYVVYSVNDNTDQKLLHRRTITHMELQGL